MIKWLMNNELEGILKRRQSWPNLGTTLSFAWRFWGKLLQTSVRIAGLEASIWTRDLSNMKQECMTLHCDIQLEITSSNTDSVFNNSDDTKSNSELEKCIREVHYIYILGKTFILWF
jgi:hypothetical protein